MPDLLPQKAQRAATSPAEERAQRARSGLASWNASMAALAGNKGEAPSGPRVFVSGLGGVSNLSEVKPAPISTSKTEEEDLPPAVQRVRHRLSAEGARFLGAMVRRAEEEGGKPINFSSDDTMALTGLSRDKALALTNAFIRDGVLCSRNGPSGGVIGYTVRLPQG